MEKWKKVTRIDDLINITKYAEESINCSIALRKLREIKIYEKNDTYYPRPQSNVMLCKLFGSDKSSTLKIILKMLGNDYIGRDDFTKPSFLGTIDKNRNYITGIISLCGGKILGIDEWNNLDPETRDSMLTTIENQHVSRSLGFRVKTPIDIKDEEGFTDIHIEEGSIEGKAQFSVIAMAMYTPTYYTIKEKALISRFRLIQHYNSMDEMTKINAGDLSYKIKDYSQPIDLVEITRNAWVEFIYAWHKELSNKGIYPLKEDYGLVNRTSIDLLHDTIYMRMKKEKCDKKIMIDDSKELLDNIGNGFTQIRMYAHKERSTFEDFVDLITVKPNMGYKFYCNALNLKKSQFYKLVKRYELNNDKRVSLIDKVDDENE
jgi:hypothetical protein